MPTSDPENKTWALDRILEIQPKMVVDIGPGEGTYSDLARKHTPDATWKAIEAWGPYVTKYGLWQKYDHVVVSDIRHTDLHSVTFAPNLVIIGDVLEHMEKVEARTVLRQLQAWADHVLVAFPVAHHDQAPFEGNWFEIHRDHWSFDEMKRALGGGIVDSVKGEVLGYFLWGAGA